MVEQKRYCDRCGVEITNDCWLNLKYVQRIHTPLLQEERDYCNDCASIIIDFLNEKAEPPVKECSPYCAYLEGRTIFDIEDSAFRFESYCGRAHCYLDRRDGRLLACEDCRPSVSRYENIWNSHPERIRKSYIEKDRKWDKEARELIRESKKNDTESL